jgi:hypothetical protein
VTWFSVSLRRASIIASEGIGSFWDSVFLVSANDRDGAWNEALKIGEGLNTSYDNGDGERIRFAFLGVLTIDELGEEIRSGVEVHFTTHDFDQPIPVSADAEFFPNRIRPSMAGIGIETPKVTE